jgi:hypothetical protein
MIVQIFFGIVIGIVFFLFWVGVFKSIQIKENTFPGGTLIYTDYKGSIKTIQ